jgi:hypothetical protein
VVLGKPIAVKIQALCMPGQVEAIAKCVTNRGAHRYGGEV